MNTFTQGTTLTVRNLEQAVLYNKELKGQISDGKWENSRPHNHYMIPCEATAVVGKQLGRNFSVKRTYDFANVELFNVVKDRMILQVKIARAFGSEAVHILSYLFEELEEGNPWHGLPKYKGKYWDGIRDQIADFAKEHGGLEVVRDKVYAQSYTAKELRSDLRDLNLSFRTRI